MEETYQMQKDIARMMMGLLEIKFDTFCYTVMNKNHSNRHYAITCFLR